MSPRSILLVASLFLSSLTVNGAVLPREPESDPTTDSSFQDISTTPFNSTTASPPTFQVKFQAATSDDAGSLPSEAALSYSIVTLRNLVLAPSEDRNAVNPFSDSYPASNLAIAVAGWPAGHPAPREHFLWGFESIMQSMAASADNKLGTYWLYFEGRRSARIEFRRLNTTSAGNDVTLPTDHSAPASTLLSSPPSSKQDLMLVSTPGTNNLDHTTHCLALARALLQITYATSSKPDAQLTDNLTFRQQNVQLTLNQQEKNTGSQTPSLTLGQAVQMIAYAAEVPLARGSWKDDTVAIEMMAQGGQSTTLAQLQFAIGSQGGSVQEVTAS